MIFFYMLCTVLSSFINSGLTYTILWFFWGAEPLAHVLAAVQGWLALDWMAAQDCGSVMTLLWTSANA